MTGNLSCSIAAVLLAGAASAATAAYVTDSNPWGRGPPDSGESHMDNAFAPGGWDQYDYTTCISAGIFDPGSGYKMIYLEGSDSQWPQWEAFMNTHRSRLEGWVTGGGCLFMNAARQGGATVSFDMGFGATLQDGPNCGPNTAVTPGHPIFDPTTGTSWTGNSFNHDQVTGITDVIRDGCSGLASLAETPYGAGHVILGGMTTTNFQQPNPACRQLRVNILTYCDGLGLLGTVEILSVDTMPTLVAPGQTGIPVTVMAQNIGMSTVDINMATIVFEDAAMVDVSADYVVTPDPGNPTTIGAGGMEIFLFTVDVTAGATLGTITVDAEFDVFDQGTGAMYTRRGATMTDSWDVVGALALIRIIDAPDLEVVAGAVGIPVTMTIENPGLNALDVVSADLTFTGTADRTSEYTVSADPGNPVAIAPGATDALLLWVAVDAMATMETIVIDGVFSGTDQVSGAVTMDLDSDVTDSWDVVDALVKVLTVDAASAIVAEGSSGHPVTVTVENLGVNPVSVFGVLLQFTGTADRTSEYTVFDDPMNPFMIGVGGMETFDFTVDVSTMATAELVTIDAAFSGLDAVRSSPVIDIGADVTDSWVVQACGATLCGDCSGDGMITIIDALFAAQHAAGLTTLTGTDFTNCNVIGLIEPDPGATVDVLDALAIAQSAAGLPVTLMCC